MTMSAPDQQTVRKAIRAGAAHGRYMLRNVRLDLAVTRAASMPATSDGEFLLADLTVVDGRILTMTPSGDGLGELSQIGGPVIDCGGRVALPAFVDCHTHLDKGHILPRTPGADGSFQGALAAAKTDREANWTADDVTRRMDFSLRCAHHHGTAAIRTHLDSQPPQDAISWPVFREMRQQWRGRIELQASCLFGIDLVRNERFIQHIARRVVAAGGILGAVAYPAPGLDDLLDRLFALAAHHNLDLDFHADETADASADSLRRIAEAALRSRFAGKVLVGHCCSLAMQDSSTVDETLDKVAAAGLAVVSLPTCNLYLQDRRHDATTPRWRGVTLLHEMKQRGVDVALASDNTRDPFHSYGDLDMLDTYRLGTKVLHLDHPAGDWIRSVSATPANVMRLENKGAITEGQPADFILFEGRSWSEVLSRAESNRIVIRNGAPIETSLPSYAELDEVARS